MRVYRLDNSGYVDLDMVLAVGPLFERLTDDGKTVYKIHKYVLTLQNNSLTVEYDSAIQAEKCRAKLVGVWARN